VKKTRPQAGVGKVKEVAERIATKHFWATDEHG
jgi:hypothetical protein